MMLKTDHKHKCHQRCKSTVPLAIIPLVMLGRNALRGVFSLERLRKESSEWSRAKAYRDTYAPAHVDVAGIVTKFIEKVTLWRNTEGHPLPQGPPPSPRCPRGVALF